MYQHITLDVLKITGLVIVCASVVIISAYLYIRHHMIKDMKLKEEADRIFNDNY